MIKAFVLATALALASAGAAASQDRFVITPASVVEAQRAYGRGDHVEAVRLWRIAADFKITSRGLNEENKT